MKTATNKSTKESVQIRRRFSDPSDGEYFLTVKGKPDSGSSSTESMAFPSELENISDEPLKPVAPTGRVVRMSPELAPDEPAPQSLESDSDRIWVNDPKLSPQKIMSIRGIGMAGAKSILKKREEEGDYSSLDDIPLMSERHREKFRLDKPEQADPELEAELENAEND